MEPTVRGFLRTLEKAHEMTRDRSSPPPYPYDESTGRITLPPEIREELRRLVSEGNKIEAVKRVTKLTGAGLRASKDYVDDLYRPGRH